MEELMQGCHVYKKVVSIIITNNLAGYKIMIDLSKNPFIYGPPVLGDEFLNHEFI